MWPQVRFIRAAHSVRKRPENHMRGPCVNNHTIAHTIQPIDALNLQMALDRWLDSGPSTDLFGYSVSYLSKAGLAHMAIHHERIAPVQRERTAFEVTGDLDCVTRGIYLLHHQAEPIAVMIHRSDSALEPHPTLELMAHNRQVAQGALSAVVGGEKPERLQRQEHLAGKRTGLEHGLLHSLSRASADSSGIDRLARRCHEGD